MMTGCSIVIPVHNRAALTRRCLDTLLVGTTDQREIIVVDDASTDETATMLREYAGRVRIVKRDENGGFAAACNDGAAAASAKNYLVFLNNDTVPRAGWLEALVGHADGHAEAAVVGSRLLFPDGTVQHAGVVICQDGYPRHIYAGFPGDHPAVSRSRGFKAVTFASALVRRRAFADVGGFDTAFRNGLEDVDLCLRLGERGWGIHYCHESVVVHLESASRPHSSPEVRRNHRLFRERWDGTVAADDLEHFVADGLLNVGYADVFPIRLSASPLLAILAHDGDDSDLARVLEQRAGQVAGLLREVTRLTIALGEQGAGIGDGAARSPTGHGDAEGSAARLSDSSALLEEDRELERLIHALQTALAERAAKTGREAVPPSDYLAYEAVVSSVHSAVDRTVPANATVALVSHGDDELLRLPGRVAMHLPQTERGTYAGYHPADSGEAIRHLEHARATGADFLVIPSGSFWWLDHYRDFADVLDREHECVHHDDACAIYRLVGRRAPQTRGA